MSHGEYPFAVARRAAGLFVANVAHTCRRIEIAGSLRRATSALLAGAVDDLSDYQAGDAEIVAIPDVEVREKAGAQADLFGNVETEEINLLWERVEAMADPDCNDSAGFGEPWEFTDKNGQERTIWGDKLRKVTIVDPDTGTALPADVFVATEANWGYIYALRTGPAGWNKLLVTPQAQGGLRPGHVRLQAGTVYVDGRETRVPDEETLFELWGLPYLAPHDRRRYAEEKAA